MSAFEELSGIGPLDIWEGVLARTVDGERVTLAVVELDPGAVVREHSHENEQLGLVLRGSLRFRIGDEASDVGPGATWRVPPNTPHEVVAGPDGAIVVDVFGPPREDWHPLARAETRPPRWP